MIEYEKTIAIVDAMAKELRRRLQGGKQLKDWNELPNGPKRKWREHALALYVIAVEPRK